MPRADDFADVAPHRLVVRALLAAAQFQVSRRQNQVGQPLAHASSHSADYDFGHRSILD